MSRVYVFLVVLLPSKCFLCRTHCGVETGSEDLLLQPLDPGSEAYYGERETRFSVVRILEVVRFKPDRRGR